MGWPVTFGTLTSPAAMSSLDTMFNQVAAGMAIPCSVVGTNALALTPLTNFPALTSYNELGGYRFRAASTSSGAVTAQFNGLGFLNVYHADGATQANIGDLVGGFEYVLRYSLSLNGGLGGFFLEAPASPVASSTWFTPGGRLTCQSATPVMVSTQSGGTLWYAPYMHPFLPIYNGTNIQMYQFTSSLADQVGASLVMGGSATWPANSAFDVYATLVSGVLTLASIAWTNPTTRAVTLQIFGGFLTNSGTNTAQTSAGAISLVKNQGTFLGSFMTSGSNGTALFQFAGAASGGSTSNFLICNYYNKVLFTTINTDNGAAYGYTSATIRQARGSVQNANLYFQCDSERSATHTYSNGINLAAANSTGVAGLGFDSTTVLSGGSFNEISITGVSSPFIRSSATLAVSATGFHQVNALEQSDGTNANIFDQGSVNSITSQIWL